MNKFQWIWRNWFSRRPLYEGLASYPAKHFITKQINDMAQKKNIVPELINANLDVIEEQVLVDLPPDIYALAKAASDKIGETAQALYDDLEPNGPQVEKIWREYVNQHLVDFATVKARQEARKIGSDILRNLVTLLIEPASGSLKDLTDEIADNGEQLKAEWVGFLKSGNNLRVLLNNTLRPVLTLIPIINDATADFLVNIAEGEIRKALEGIPIDPIFA